MSTIVQVEDILEAKIRISDALLCVDMGVILSASLLVLEKPNNNEKKWMPRKCVLSDDLIEIFDEETDEILDEIDLVDFHVKIMKGFAFSLQKNDGSCCVLFDADSSELRRRWLIAITYQMAVREPLVSFAPFHYAPPIRDAAHRLILCGYLSKLGAARISWSAALLRLTPAQLTYVNATTGAKKVIKVNKIILTFAFGFVPIIFCLVSFSIYLLALLSFTLSFYIFNCFLLLFLLCI